MFGFLNPRLRAMRAGDPGKLAVLMATAFIDMVGTLIIIPLLPFYATHFGANGFMVMVLVSAFSAMQLVSAPLWGRVSDRYGRKPALLIGLSASALAYIVFGFADSYWLLLVSRLIQGAGGGTTAVIQAYVADSVEPRNRARGLGWLSAATNAGVVLGPLFGSFSSQLGRHSPGLLAAALCLLNIAFAARFLHESRAGKRRAGGRTPLQAIWRVVWSHAGEPSSRLVWIYALGTGAFYGVNALLILYLHLRFGVTERTIGIFYAYVGLLSIIFRIGLLGRVVDRLGEARTMRIGVTLLAAGLALIPFTSPLAVRGLSLLPLGLVVALLPLGTALAFPSVTALLSRVVGEGDRGLYMGVQQTYGGVARVAFPLIAGQLWDTLGVGFPFWLSALTVAMTIPLTRGLVRVADEREGRDEGEPAAVERVIAERPAEGPAVP